MSKTYPIALDAQLNVSVQSFTGGDYLNIAFTYYYNWNPDTTAWTNVIQKSYTLNISGLNIYQEIDPNAGEVNLLEISAGGKTIELTRDIVDLNGNSIRLSDILTQILSVLGI